MFTVDENIPSSQNRLKEQYFRRDNIITKSRLCEVYKRLPKNTDHKDVLCLSLVVALEGILLGDQKSNKINLDYLCLVEDLDKFNNFPWGKIVYDFTVRKMKYYMVNRVTKNNKTLKKIQEEFEEELGEDDVNMDVNEEDYKARKSYASTSYNVYGFPLALQVWAYEAMPDLVCQLSSDSMPRILKWENNKTGRWLRLKYLERTYFSHDDLSVKEVLAPTEMEKETLYYKASVASTTGKADEFGEQLFENTQRVDKGKEKLNDEYDPSSSTTSIDKVLEEVLVVKQEVREIKQMLASIVHVLNKGNINVPFEGHNVFERSSPLGAYCSGDVDATAGVNIGCDIARNSNETVIGEEEILSKSEGIPVDSQYGQQDKACQIMLIEEELQKKHLAVQGYEIEKDFGTQSEDVDINDPDYCTIVSGPTPPKKYYMRKHRSVGTSLRSPYEIYKNVGRKRKASRMDQSSNVLDYYNVYEGLDLDKYFHFISWLHK